MTTKFSGHARLKAALVLRDALTADLGLSLPAVMRQLANVEDSLGARDALEAGRYLEALASLCRHDADVLTQRYDEVRAACAKAQLAPRYAQFLALILFAHWLDASTSDPAAFLHWLNDWLTTHPPRGEAMTPFIEADLQFAAFWMATAAGKTHVLHACLALLEQRHRWDRILLVTPSEALTRQHADKLRATRQWPVFAYPLDGDLSALGRQPPDTVIVLDINKLADAKTGDGMTVPTTVFKDGRNLVFVDEGHKGQRSEASAWKRLQQDLAGIASPDPRCRGLLLEFSATFGQVAEAEHAFDRYAKSVIFDYAYDRFHTDRYGKDFWHIKLDSRGEIGAVVQRQTLTAALIAFWHQLASYRRLENKSPQPPFEKGGNSNAFLPSFENSNLASPPFEKGGNSNAFLPSFENSNLASPPFEKGGPGGISVAAPLWVLLGLSVIGGNTKSDAEQTSDVVDVLRFLAAILRQPAEWAAWVDDVLTLPLNGADLLPPEVRTVLTDAAAATLAPRLLTETFGWRPGDKPVFRLLKSAAGELGLGLLRGDGTHYFGVVNVGDANGLKKTLEAAGFSVDEDALTPSLFAGLGQSGSGINLLIGSRRFAEGWDNYRASSLTLLRLGQGEGALIIQMFGRVVRFAGQRGDGKRLENPPAALRPLQTAYIYGLHSKYLETFLNSLYANGVAELRRIECPTRLDLPESSPLKAVVTITPGPRDFTVEVQGDGWLSGINKVTLSLTAAVTTATLTRTGVNAAHGVAGSDITEDFKQRLHLLDRDELWRELVEFKRLRRWWNFAFDRAALEAALTSDRYQINGLPAVLDIRDAADLLRLNRLAATVLRRLFESAYRKQENRHNRYAITAAAQSGIPKVYRKEFMYGQEE